MLWQPMHMAALDSPALASWACAWMEKPVATSAINREVSFFMVAKDGVLLGNHRL
jgi:hypothetical protein